MADNTEYNKKEEELQRIKDEIVKHYESIIDLQAKEIELLKEMNALQGNTEDTE